MEEFSNTACILVNGPRTLRFVHLRDCHLTIADQVKARARSAAELSYASLKEKKAWDIAISPAKSLPMQAFMLYMSGGGVQIFSMGIVFMLLLQPFKNAAVINSSMYSFDVPTTRLF